MTTAELLEALRALSSDERRALALALLSEVEEEGSASHEGSVPSDDALPWPVFSSTVAAGQGEHAFDHRRHRAARLDELVERALSAHRS